MNSLVYCMNSLIYALKYPLKHGLIKVFFCAYSLFL
jgi:hypothetical protein